MDVVPPECEEPQEETREKCLNNVESEKVQHL